MATDIKAPDGAGPDLLLLSTPMCVVRITTTDPKGNPCSMPDRRPTAPAPPDWHGQGAASQSQQADISQLSFEERLGLLGDSGLAERESRQNTARLKRARLKSRRQRRRCQFPPSAWPRQGLVRAPDDRTLGQRAPECADLRPDRRRQETFLACALANQACRQGIQPLRRKFAAPLAGAGHQPG